MSRNNKNDNEISSLKLKVIVIIYILVAVFIICFIRLCYRGMSNDNWYSMLLSYLGGAIGGLATLIAIYISTEQNNKIQIKNRKQEIKPIVDFNCNETIKVVFNIVDSEKLVIDDITNLEFQIFNLSQYPAKDFYMSISMDEQNFIDISSANGIKLVRNDVDKNILEIWGKNIEFLTFKDGNYNFETKKRFIFRDKNLKINFVSEPILYKSFFEALIMQYIKINYNNSHVGCCFINKGIAEFIVKFSYKDIEDELISQRYSVLVKINFMQAMLSNNELSLNLRNAEKCIVMLRFDIQKLK